jgi:hypothetical protein
MLNVVQLHLETPGVVMLEGRVLLTTARWGAGLALRYLNFMKMWTRI